MRLARTASSDKGRSLGTRNAAQMEPYTPQDVGREVDSVPALLPRNTDFPTDGDFDEVVRARARAIAVSPGNSSAYEDYADALLAAGRPDEAADALRQAIALDGQEGFARHMSLGQLLGNSMEAVLQLKTGIGKLRIERSSASPKRCAELTGYEVSALCSLAETLLGIAEESRDCAVAEGIDTEIESVIVQAVAISTEGSPEEVEASMALANLRLSQSRSHEALVAMQRVVSAMRVGLEILNCSEVNADDAVRGVEMLPPMDVRIAAGKQLLEVGLWSDAVDVLNSVLYECDFNIEVWYMLAVGYHHIPDPDSAMSALQQARDLLSVPDGFVGQLDEDTIAEQEEIIKRSAAAVG
jgi:tetratricopeptide (TPR) repeat protein